MDLREIGCEDGSWMELAQDRVQWWNLLFAVLNLLVLLPNVCNNFESFSQSKELSPYSLSQCSNARFSFLAANYIS